MVNVRQIAEMGAYVQLLEYDNIEGMILLSELSRRRIRSIQKLIRVGKNEVVVVLRVDKEKGELMALLHILAQEANQDWDAALSKENVGNVFMWPAARQPV